MDNPLISKNFAQPQPQPVPLRIALLTYATKPRGSVIHTLELAAALSELGHQVRIYALDKDGLGFDPPPPCAVTLVPTRSAPADTDALIRQRIQEFVAVLSQERQTFDIYHAQDCIGANALLTLRQRGQIAQVVRTVHHVEDYPSPYLRQCQDRSIRQVDLCLCVSQRWQQVLSQDYGLKVPQVINGVNLRRFSRTPSGQEPALKQRYSLGGGPIYLTVGGIEPRKNSIRLLMAFAQVRRTYPRAQLVVAGGATLFDYQPYRERFFNAAYNLGVTVGEALILPGVVPAADLPDLYRCADVFCFPSLKEGWGLVVLEAIACGLPVVVPAQAPFSEYLHPDQALWVNPEDLASLAVALVRGADPTSQAGGERSRSILPAYSWSQSARLHESHYRQLLEQSPVHA